MSNIENVIPTTLSIQQTPKPLAQVPSAVPPISEHSLLVKQVPLSPEVAAHSVLSNLTQVIRFRNLGLLTLWSCSWSIAAKASIRSRSRMRNQRCWTVVVEVMLVQLSVNLRRELERKGLTVSSASAGSQKKLTCRSEDKRHRRRFQWTENRAGIKRVN